MTVVSAVHFAAIIGSALWLVVRGAHLVLWCSLTFWLVSGWILALARVWVYIGEPHFLQEHDGDALANDRGSQMLFWIADLVVICVLLYLLVPRRL
jgi:hypothetical protein